MKILLVEDDSSTRELLAFHLSAARYVVEQATDGATALELAMLWNYDLIVLDINLPKLDGIRLCRHLRLQGMTTPILMITAQDDTADVISGLDAGADDYVTKPFDMQGVLARIRALLRRGTTTTAMPTLAWGQLCLDPNLAQVTYCHRVVPLTPKEYSLLELFLRHPQRVFSRSAILDQLWTIDDSPTEGAVTNLVKDLRNRLKRSGVVENIIQTVYGLGYRLRQLPASTEAPIQTQPLLAVASPILSETAASSPNLASIIARFQASIHQRLAILEDAIRSLQAGGLDQQQRQVACDEAHRLAGGLGTFGYDDSSTWAQQIETLFQLEGTLGPSEVAQLSRCVLALKQSLTAQPDKQTACPSSTPCCQIMVLNLEPELADAMQQMALMRQWRVDLALTLTGLMDAIHQRGADGVLLALDPAGPDTARLAPLRELKSHYPDLPVLVLASHDSLEERVQVARLKGDCYLTTPATVEQILAFFDQILSKAQPSESQVMVVDNDLVTLSTIDELLTPWGLRVIGVDDPRQFWNNLRETQPDLLLLAIDMPTFSGIELCQVVRQDPQYGNLPILMIAAYADTVTIHQVFEVGGDDLIGKPIVGPELVTRVLSRIERSRLRQQLEQMRQRQIVYWGQQDKTDFLTQVANSRHFDAFLRQQWERHCRDQAPISLILCTPDNFTAYQQTYGLQASHQLLRRMARTLHHAVNPNIDLVARCSDIDFGIVLPNTNLDGALRVATRIQQAIAQLCIACQADQQSHCISLSLGIGGTTPTAAMSSDHLLKTAHQALQEAKARGGNTFCLYPM
jgi:diguanylate cyclase (GGDEF)-like protein